MVIYNNKSLYDSKVETKSNKHEKILFKYYSNVLDEITVERLWAEVVDKENGVYKLDSIPFYGPFIATDDEFYAEFDEDEQTLVYRRTIKYSGNSVVLVVIMQDGFDKEIIRNQLKQLNCLSEGMNDSYFSVEILNDVNYAKIVEILDEYEEEGIIEYAEPCLSGKHQNDLIDGD